MEFHLVDLNFPTPENGILRIKFLVDYNTIINVGNHKSVYQKLMMFLQRSEDN